MNEEEKRKQKIEKLQNLFENDLKAAGYYDGKEVIIIAGIDGLRVKSLKLNKKKEDLRPVHCQCSLISQDRFQQNRKQKEQFMHRILARYRSYQIVLRKELK